MIQEQKTNTDILSDLKRLALLSPEEPVAVVIATWVALTFEQLTKKGIITPEDHREVLEKLGPAFDELGF
jgi:hypothetical protein